jgi:hypothetical protein
MGVTAAALSTISLFACMERPAPRIGTSGGPVRSGGRFFARTDIGEARPLDLRALAVRATTHPGTVRSHLVMEIAGPRDARVEAVMRLPVPRGAAVTGAVLWVGGRPMNAAFVERGRAQAVYKAIVAQQGDPALVTCDGPGWVAARWQSQLGMPSGLGLP